MTPQEKRKQTIIARYGSFKNMYAGDGVKDLILGGYNGGIRRVEKGFAKWDEEKFRRFVAGRKRDSRGRFVAEARPTKIHFENPKDQKSR